MIEDLKPYPQYKDSGLAWLGKVPAHWGIARSKRLFRQRKEFAKSDDQQLSATQAFGVIPQALYEQRTGYRVVKISMHLNKRKHVQADDFVISMRSFQGGLERAWAAGAIRSSYVVLEPGAEVSAGYFQHLFKSHQYINALRATSDFIRDGQDLNFGNFCGVDLPLIPLQEQAAIARFLAWATNRLDRAIGAKRRIIALLQEQRQAIIHRAVTRGLDPSVPLKDSGIPWLGEIPEHWEITRIKSLIREIDWRTSTGEEELLSLRMHAGLVPHNAVSSIPIASEALIGFKKVSTGQLVMNRMRAAIGMFGISERPGLVSPDYAVFEQTKPLCLKYLLALFQTPGMCRAFRVESKGLGTRASGFMRLYSDRFGAIRVPLPPLDEQLEIADAIKEQTSGIESIKKRVDSEITLLREYRTRLIADVVTGKLDVRELAKGLPEEELQDQPDVAAGYDAGEAENDDESDLIDTAED
jgi:type I restriction enzyme S subunit